jgi:hypothetical protein
MSPALPILAQVEPSPTALIEWLRVLMYFVGVIGGLLGIAVAVKMLRGKDPETPQPLMVSAHPGIASASDLKQVHGRIERERKEIDASLGQLREEDKQLRARLDSEIKDMNQTIDEIPQRTIALLAATKGLL